MINRALLAICICVYLTVGSAEAVRRLGCFVDKSGARDMPVMSKSDRNTQRYCIDRCNSLGFKYAGLQTGDWCHCGDTYGLHGKVADSECSKKCTGNNKKTCGGEWRNEIFTTGIRKPDSRRLGCFIDTKDNDLKVGGHVGSKATQKYCIEFCKLKGYLYAGAQAGEWCTCGNTYGRHGMAKDSDCNSKCAGNLKQTCGGQWRNEIFVTKMKKYFTVRRIGCFVDKSGARDMPVMSKSDKTTQKYCIKRCRSLGYKYAGLQAGDWCHCGNTYGVYGRAANSECSRKCKGDDKETCGGDWRNEIFTTGYMKPE